MDALTSQIMQSQPMRLAGLLRLGNDDAELGSDADLASMLSQVLAAPLDYPGAGLSASERVQMQRSAASATPPIHALADLLRHPAPPLALLECVKNAAKARVNEAGQSVVQKVWLAVYYAAIASGWVRHGEKISTQADARLAEGFRWALAQSWLDATMKGLVAEAFARSRSCCRVRK